jgi:Family of unknown function (DUF5681)
MSKRKSNVPPTYEVGYGRPPAATQFKKGQSGNPKGRPKGTLNFATVLARTLREQVVINEGGVRKTVTKLEAATKQLVNKAASGDPGASRQLVPLLLTVEQQSKEGAVPVRTTDDADQKIVMQMLKRHGVASEEGTDE